MSKYTKQPWHKLYKTGVWLRLRGQQLAAQPVCKYCRKENRVTAACVVDHVIPHKGDEALFFDADNLQSLCKHCHDRHKQRQERTGILVGGDLDGIPIDPLHHWNT